MDARTFDTFTRHVTTGLPRRAIVSLLAGAVATDLFGGDRGARAACKNVGRKCDRNSDCCDGARCKNGKCTCKNGRQECDGKCYAFDTDETHCGACGNACAAGETCCDGECVDLQFDDDRCGDCDVECVPNQVCQEGRCKREEPL